MNQKQKDLLTNSLKFATFKQTLVVCLWWYIIRRKKFNKLINNLEKGYSWYFAYQNTKLNN
jgi:hypothetical protein